MSPERSRHAATIDLALDALRRAFGASHTIRVRHPLAAGDESEPQPDLAVVPGTPRDYVERHPRSASLVVEVSDTSLAYDRTRKGRVYARAGVADYCIINLVEAVLEVHRDPGPDGYRSIVQLGSGQTVSPLAAGSSTVAVSDLLP